MAHKDPDAFVGLPEGASERFSAIGAERKAKFKGKVGKFFAKPGNKEKFSAKRKQIGTKIKGFADRNPEKFKAKKAQFKEKRAARHSKFFDEFVKREGGRRAGTNPPEANIPTPIVG